jgi:hypothetical protein
MKLLANIVGCFLGAKGRLFGISANSSARAWLEHREAGEIVNVRLCSPQGPNQQPEHVANSHSSARSTRHIVIVTAFLHPTLGSGYSTVEGKNGNYRLQERRSCSTCRHELSDSSQLAVDG